MLPAAPGHGSCVGAVDDDNISEREGSFERCVSSTHVRECHWYRIGAEPAVTFFDSTLLYLLIKMICCEWLASVRNMAG